LETSTPRSGGEGRARRARWIVAGETGLALSLGAFQLGHNSLWNDEVFSVRVTSGSWSSLFRSLHVADANMSLYDFLLRLWRAFGTSDAALRSLSVVAFAATVPVVYAIGRRLIGRNGALFAGLLMAVAPFAVQYAQQVRSYALVAFLVSLASLCLVIGLQDRRPAAWAGYSIVGALAMYAHFFAALVLIAHALTLLLSARRRLATRQVVVSYLGLVVLATPAVVVALRGPRGQLNWLTRPGLHAALGQASHLAGGAVTATAFAFVLLVSTPMLIKSWRSTEWGLPLLLSWLVVPYALALGLSVVATPVFKDRFLIVSLPALVLLAAWCVMRFEHRWSVVAAAVLVGASLIGVVRWYREAPFQDWRTAANFVHEHVQPGDRLRYCASSDGASFRYYYLRQIPGTAPLSNPARSTALQADRIWFMTSDGHPRCGNAASRLGYERVGTTRFPGVHVQLYSRRL
jgi:mannosyltransferase